MAPSNVAHTYVGACHFSGHSTGGQSPLLCLVHQSFPLHSELAVYGSVWAFLFAHLYTCGWVLDRGGMTSVKTVTHVNSATDTPSVIYSPCPPLTAHHPWMTGYLVFVHSSELLPASLRCPEKISPSVVYHDGEAQRAVAAGVFSSESFGGDRGHRYSPCNPPERHFQWGLIVD